MALESISGSGNSNFDIRDPISASEQHPKASKFTSFFPHNNIPDPAQAQHIDCDLCPFNVHAHCSTSPMMFGSSTTSETVVRKPNSGCQGKKKRRRRPRVCKNKEEAETQRMTHIAVERNRRKQMNEHLAALRSLMPESYIQRSDQASTVGGAIDFVKELEQHLQSLEAQKRLLSQEKIGREAKHENVLSTTTTSNIADLGSPPFAQFFTYPQYSWCQVPKEHPAENRRAVADIEATMIESYANLRILSRKRSRQLMRMVTGFQSLRLTILHLNVTTLDPFVLYSLSLKVEEGCHLSSADDIASAVHHMLTIIEDEADLLLPSQLG